MALCPFFTSLGGLGPDGFITMISRAITVFGKKLVKYGYCKI